MSQQIPVPFVHKTITTQSHQFYVGVSMYSNLLHIIITENGRPGLCIQYIPHSKFGSDPTIQYELRTLVGELDPIHELIMKQIASCDILSSYAIPFICNLMIPVNINRDELLVLVNETKTFIDMNQEEIKRCFKPLL